ncbi:MAG: carboxymuconolactone decarboxylase family protein [Candidatus Palauibacterales bacterium]|nr:carboxymuconolactone decarboxylase family protein [Candidatus Palauibacterales bacterium]
MQELSHTAVAGAPVAIEPRMALPELVAPAAWEGVQRLLGAVRGGGLPESTLELAHMRVSQINGCSACIEGAIRHAHRTGQEPDERLIMVAAWPHSSEFTEAERAALELAEEMTRLADRPDPVPDETWARAAEHYDREALAALVLHVALTNLFNRLNVATRQPAGDW